MIEPIMIDIKSLSELRLVNSRIFDRVLRVELNKLDLLVIPEKIFEFRNMKLLSLSSNLLTKIPDKISKLVNLEELYLDRNKLTELPDEIGELSKLRKLILSNNKIRNFPENFYKLSNLEILNIVSNELEQITDDVGKMVKLEYLYLRSNKLKYISKNLGKIKEVSIYTDSYDNINNLSEDSEYLQINGLRQSLTNLPVTIKEIRLYLPTRVDIKRPFDCALYVDDKLVEN